MVNQVSENLEETEESSIEESQSDVSSQAPAKTSPIGPEMPEDVPNGERCAADEMRDAFLAVDADSKLSKQKNKELSHRDIEKRRRDRINRSLWRLKDLIPPARQKHESRKNLGARSGRLEKAELLELTVEYLQRMETRIKGESDPGSSSDRSSGAIQSNQVIAESAKEIYLAGLKDGVRQTADSLLSSSLITNEQRDKLLASLDFSQMNIPDIFLTHNKKRKRNMSDLQGVPSYSLRTYNSCYSRLGTSQNSNRNHEKLNLTQIKDEASSVRDSMADLPPLISRDSLANAETSDPSASGDESGETSGSLDERVCSSMSSGRSLSTPNSGSSQYDNPFPSVLKSSPEASENVNPILLPAYVLHASRTHYVPVILPQDLLFGSLMMASKAQDENARKKENNNNNSINVTDDEKYRDAERDATVGSSTEAESNHIRVISSPSKHEPSMVNARRESSNHTNPNMSLSPRMNPNLAPPHMEASLSGSRMDCNMPTSRADWNPHDCQECTLLRRQMDRRNGLPHDDHHHHESLAQECGRHLPVSSSAMNAAELMVSRKRSLSDAEMQHESNFRAMFMNGLNGLRMPSAPPPSEYSKEIPSRYFFPPLRPDRRMPSLEFESAAAPDQQIVRPMP